MGTEVCPGSGRPGLDGTPKVDRCRWCSRNRVRLNQGGMLGLHPPGKGPSRLLPVSTHGCQNRQGRYRVTVSSEDGEVFASVLVDALGPERAVGIVSDVCRSLGWVDVLDGER